MKSDKKYLPGIVFVLLWLNTGVYAVVSTYIPSIVPYGVAGILLCCWIYTNKRYRMRWNKICFPIVAFYPIALINYYLLGNRELVPTHILYLIISLSFGLYCFELSGSTRKVIVYALVVDYLIIGINSWIVLSKYPELSRFLAAGAEKMEQYRSMGLIPTVAGLKLIGSYGYFNSLVFISMVLLYKTRSEQQLSLRILYALITVLSVLLIVKGAFTTALIMVTIGLLSVSLPRSAKNRALVITIFIMMIVIFYVSNAIPTFFQFLANMESLSDASRLRFYDIYMTLDNNSQNASSIFARTVLYRDSLYAFFISPIGGHMFWGNYEIGQHSTFCDYLGRYGLFTLFLFTGLKRYMKAEILFVKSKSRIIQTTWLIFLLTSFINPVFIQNIFITLFVFVPCFLKQDLEINSCNGMEDC